MLERDLEKQPPKRRGLHPHKPAVPLTIFPSDRINVQPNPFKILDEIRRVQSEIPQNPNILGNRARVSLKMLPLEETDGNNRPPDPNELLKEIRELQKLPPPAETLPFRRGARRRT